MSAADQCVYATRAAWRKKKIHYRWVFSDWISPHLAVALVASEDQKFPTHRGFDFESIARALDEDKIRMRVSASSPNRWPRITSCGREEVICVRESRRIFFTVLVETLWCKRRILEIYMNVVEFGPGIFGVEAASRQFFKKPAPQLSLWEVSLLAAVLPNPQKMSADRPSAYVRDRAVKIRA